MKTKIAIENKFKNIENIANVKKKMLDNFKNFFKNP